MKNSFIFRGLLGMLLLAGMACPSVVRAEDALLAQTEVRYKGENIKAQLWGDKQTSGYANDLLLVLKRKDGSVITGYKPSVKGGYGCGLTAVQLKEKDGETEQLLVSIRQGDWTEYSEYRILDISNSKAIKELFNTVDSSGVVARANLNNETLVVKTIKDEKPINVDLDAKLLEGIADNRKQVSYGKIQSLVPMDINNDGVKELLSNQQITVDKRILADVGAVWYFNNTDKQSEAASEKEAVEKNTASKVKNSHKNNDKSEAFFKATVEKIRKELAKLEAEDANSKDSSNTEKESKTKNWRHNGLTIMKAGPTDKKNSVNKGKAFKSGMIYPVKLVARGGEATYPQIVLNNNIPLANDLNKLLLEEAEVYMKAFLKGQADVAFTVVRADDKILTLQIISGKDKFVHHNINILAGRDKKAELKDIFKVKSKAFIELLNVLNTNTKLTWDKKLTDEWYIVNGKLFLMKNLEGVDEISGYDMNNLKKHIINTDFISVAKK